MKVKMRAYQPKLGRQLRHRPRPWGEWLLANFKGWLSSHGQTYLRPLDAIVALGMAIAVARPHGTKAWPLVPAVLQSGLVWVNGVLNQLVTGIIIFRPITHDFPGFEFLSALGWLFSSTCVSHFLVTVRRHNRR